MEQAEIAKIMKESQGEDDEYIYMPDSARAGAKLRQDDSVWKPGSSLEAGPIARKSSAGLKSFSAAQSKPAKHEHPHHQQQQPPPQVKPTNNAPPGPRPEKEKKPKKGLATVKQRLAKKLKL